MYANSDPESVWEQMKQMTDQEKKYLTENIAKKMSPQPVKIRGDFDLYCFTFEGIDAIKKALIAGKNAVNDESFQASFKMIAPPMYKCEVFTLEKQKAIGKLEEAMKVIADTIKESGGQFTCSLETKWSCRLCRACLPAFRCPTPDPQTCRCQT